MLPRAQLRVLRPCVSFLLAFSRAPIAAVPGASGSSCSEPCASTEGRLTEQCTRDSPELSGDRPGLEPGSWLCPPTFPTCQAHSRHHLRSLCVYLATPGPTCTAPPSIHPPSSSSLSHYKGIPTPLLSLALRIRARSLPNRGARLLPEGPTVMAYTRVLPSSAPSPFPDSHTSPRD